MFQLAKILLYDEEEAKDIVHDIFLKMMESDIVPAEEKIRSYLMTAVRNGCLNRIRKKSFTEQVRGLYSQDIETEWQNDQERMAALKNLYDFAESYLQEPHRTIFRLRFEGGLTLKEIAQKMDMNLKTVFKYLSTSIQNVQRQYKRNKML
ncbi:MAG: sigma-70 family RNA polymerase sigma factor [Bacteroidaceae bacterium]|nr:sigma-70 family RNA polymerase sigma factor [Bacteroidaceae bacterium]